MVSGWTSTSWKHARPNRTRLIVITNLHNPSGALTSEDDLRAIGAIAERCGAHVLVDEVYLDSAVPPRRTSAHLGPQFVVTNSLTKVYGLSGLRCGWILAEPALAERMWRLNDLFGVNQPHQSEMLSCIAFDHLDESCGGQCRAARRQSRDLQRLRRGARRHRLHDGRAWHHRLSRAGPGATPSRSTRCCDRNMTPRSSPAAGSTCPNHFRVGLGGDTEVIKEGLARLGAALDELA